MRVSLVGCVLFLAACNVFDPSLVEDFDAGTSVPDVPVVEDVPVVDDVPVAPDVPIVENGCEGAGWARPPMPVGEDTGDQELILGMHNLLLNQDGERWRNIGRNLDGLCSTPPDPIVECQPRLEGDSPLIDGEGGIDNAFGGPFFATVDLVAPDLEGIATNSSEAGTGAVILRIRGYNGELDDPRVEVAVMQSVYGIAGEVSETEPPAHDAVNFEAMRPGTMERMPLPAWEGHDWLFPRDDNFYDDDLENPRVVTINAYVSGGVLVAEIEDNVPFNFASAIRGITAKLTDGLIIAYIHPSLENYRRVDLSGRWKVNELLQAARTVEICAGTPQLSILTNQLDKIADVLANPSVSNDVPCDALSVGILWSFDVVRLGPPALSALPPDLCED